MTADSPADAAQTFLFDIFESGKTVDPLIFVSEAGWIADLYEFDMLDAVDESQTFVTSQLMREMVEEYDGATEDDGIAEDFLRIADEIDVMTKEHIEKIEAVNLPLANVLKQAVKIG